MAERTSNSRFEKLREKLAGVSSGPGVYLMKNKNGQVLYVGKARNLKKRVSSYFSLPATRSSKTTALVNQISMFETIVTATEKEALILESNLIKRYRPKYNVTLKDDKRYPALRLDLKETYPYLQIVRKLRNDGALYFGPYASAHAVRQTLKFIHKTFKLRKCCGNSYKRRNRSCLNYQMGTCLGPCCHDVGKDTYDEAVKEVILFLKGRAPILINNLKKQMQIASDNQEFEKAAALRDKIFSLKKTLEHQHSVITDFKDRDVIGVSTSSQLTIVTILFIRGGYLLGQRHFHFSETVDSDDVLLSAFIRQYYEENDYVPKEILLSALPRDSELIMQRLEELKREKVILHQPVRGEKAKLVKMAIENAQKELSNQSDLITSKRALLEKLQKRLRLQRMPVRIECFDNSNLSGSEAVSAMVVFDNGEPMRSGYRKYKIRDVVQPDDYGYMREILWRRFEKKDKKKPLPDLLVLDGGKGQLNIAVSVLTDLNLVDQFDVIAIAKKDELKGENEDKIYKVGRSNPVIFGKDRELLLFLQRIRDEAHRFVITFHRNRRANHALQSILDNITGVGPKRKKILLSNFGSIDGIRAASIEDLAALPGMNIKTAEKVRDYLKD